MYLVNIANFFKKNRPSNSLRAYWIARHYVTRYCVDFVVGAVEM